MSVSSLVRALGGRKQGSGFMAKCPAHDDHNPSLSIRQDNSGTLLVHCHAGCQQQDVIDALKSRGLWEVEERKKPIHERIVCTYDYTDERGGVLYQVVRLRDPKDFFQRRPDGRGGWIPKKSSRQVLYRLREVLEAPIVFLVEGEKDVERLRDHGFVATTAAGGAKAPWLPSFTRTLAGREVILIPDNDQPGRQRVLTIARALLGHASQIICIELPGGKDTSDWFDAGHSEVELINLVEREQVAD